MTAVLTDKITVVLVEPNDDRNVGAVARAMSNLGFCDLRISGTRLIDRAEAAKSACWAEPLVQSARCFATLPEAIGDLHEVYGFCGRWSKDRGRHFELREWAAETRERIAVGTTGRIGIMFGPEDTGLLDEHTAHCRAAIRIDSAADCPPRQRAPGRASGDTSRSHQCSASV